MPLAPELKARIPRQAHLIISYPRSGSRWLLCPLLPALVTPSERSQQYFDITLQSQISEAQQIPDIPATGSHAFYRANALPDILPADCTPVIRTHHDRAFYQPAGPRIVYPVRRFPAVLASYWIFQKGAKAPLTGKAFRQFAAQCEREWRAHVEAALHYQAKQPDRILIVIYGETRPFSAEQLKTIAAWVNIDCSDRRIATVLERFDHMLHGLNRVTAGPLRRGTNQNARTCLPRDLYEAYAEANEALFLQAAATSTSQSGPVVVSVA